jgi:hypothetical protein
MSPEIKAMENEEWRIGVFVKPFRGLWILCCRHFYITRRKTIETIQKQTGKGNGVQATDAFP